jgi:hypothetical protein
MCAKIWTYEKKIHIIFIIKSLNAKFVNNHKKIGSSKELNLPLELTRFIFWKQ